MKGKKEEEEDEKKMADANGSKCTTSVASDRLYEGMQHTLFCKILKLVTKFSYGEMLPAVY
jgi:hypothetical protein